MLRMIKAGLAAISLALVLGACSDASKQRIATTVAKIETKVKEGVIKYCNFRDTSSIDDLVRLGLELAIADNADDLVKAAVDHACAIARPPAPAPTPAPAPAPSTEPKVARVDIPAELLRSLPFPLPRV